MTKEMVFKTLQNLPDEFDAEELYERLVVIDKVEQARKQADQGLGSTLEEVEARFQKKWANQE